MLIRKQTKSTNTNHLRRLENENLYVHIKHRVSCIIILLILFLVHKHKLFYNFVCRHVSTPCHLLLLLYSIDDGRIAIFPKLPLKICCCFFLREPQKVTQVTGVKCVLCDV